MSTPRTLNVWRLLLTVPLVLLSACMVGPDYERQEPEPPAKWHTDLSYTSMTEASLTDLEWTEIFRDEQLRDLILTALDNNKDMLLAIERIEEARAGSVIARSALFPTVDLELDSEREDESQLTNTDAEQVDEFASAPPWPGSWICGGVIAARVKRLSGATWRRSAARRRCA